MPATATHAFFAEDVYEKINNKYKNIINKKSLLMFAQSMDSMMFYNITSLKRAKKLRTLANTFHTKHINKYFNNLITYIKEKKYYNDPQTLSYLYGLICHYSLDTTAHPYIFYKTGRFDKNDKATLKYNSLHNYMETYIDNIMINKKGNSYDKFNFKELCFDFTKFSNELNDSIKQSFQRTYNVNNMDKIYYKSLKQMCFILQVFRIDHYGVKKKFYKLIDLVLPKNTLQLKSLSYYEIEDDYDYLNKRKTYWMYPANNNIKSNKSFFEVYDDAIEIAVNIIEEVNNYLFNDKPVDINNLFKNKSYLTGLDCDKDLKLQYFEF